mmetsp:Transcript_57305/g.125464  ORF Transcript_57305/g.125464 Transcript_57305/m.125464 type:complete len:239 (-) Transcript_57305:271-987(-)
MSKPGVPNDDASRLQQFPQPLQHGLVQDEMNTRNELELPRQRFQIHLGVKKILQKVLCMVKADIVVQRIGALLFEALADGHTHILPGLVGVLHVEVAMPHEKRIVSFQFRKVSCFFAAQFGSRNRSLQLLHVFLQLLILSCVVFQQLEDRWIFHLKAIGFNGKVQGTPCFCWKGLHLISEPGKPSIQKLVVVVRRSEVRRGGLRCTSAHGVKEAGGTPQGIHLFVRTLLPASGQIGRH